MEEIIRRLAHISVLRGCGFGTLTILTGMMGVAFDLSLVLKTGGIGMLLMAFILILKAARVYQTPLRTTEVWIMLDERDRPPVALARGMIAEARRDVMLLYAYFSAIVSAALLISGGLSSIAR